MTYATKAPRIGILGSHGMVGSHVASFLGNLGYNLAFANRTRRFPEEPTEIVDAYNAPSIRKFAAELDVVINCAGPSCLIKKAVADALPPGVVYIDAFGANEFDDYQPTRPCVINTGCTPGLSGLLIRHLAKGFDCCDSADLYSGGRDQGGIAGFADIVLSIHNSYGHPGCMISHDALERYEDTPLLDTGLDILHSEEPVVSSAFVTEELLRVARDCGIPRLYGFNILPDRALQRLLLRTVSQTYSANVSEMLQVFAEVDSAKAQLDAGKTHWFTMTAKVQGTLHGRQLTSTATIYAPNSSIITALLVASAAEHVVTHELLPGVYWGYEILDPEKTFRTLTCNGIRVNAPPPVPIAKTSMLGDGYDYGML